MNIIYMPAGSSVWIDTAKELSENSFNPKIWFGDSRHDEFAKNNYNDCLVIDFHLVHKEIYLNCEQFKLDTNIYQDKFFYQLKDQVYKIMDRQDDFGIYSRLDRESFFYSTFSFFYSEIKKRKIDVLVSSEGPHSPVSMVIYGASKLLGIPAYHLAQNSVVPFAHICKDFSGSKIKVENHKNLKTALNFLEDYVDAIDEEIPKPLYMMLQDQYDHKPKPSLLSMLKRSVAHPILNIVNLRVVNNYLIYRSDFYKNNRLPIFYPERIASRKKKLYRSYQESVAEVDLGCEYVFLPLHYEPEKTSNPDGGLFYNAYDMILSLRSFLPSNVTIVIKEHPSQFTNKLHGHRGRGTLFYKSVLTLPNVIFISLDIPSSVLIKNSLFVATQTGTAALEAAILGKKSLVFGSPWYLGAPNVYHYDDIESIYSILNEAIYTRDDVKRYILDYIERYTLPVCVNPSGNEYFKLKYPDSFDLMKDDAYFAKKFVSAISKDLE